MQHRGGQSGETKRGGCGGCGGRLRLQHKATTSGENLRWPSWKDQWVNAGYSSMQGESEIVRHNTELQVKANNFCSKEDFEFIACSFTEISADKSGSKIRVERG
jgi:hypothetical protein